ncbi:hypothetical protein K1719_038020 [Acacia pycnantha]|nr:hypothetical protein K1719_038020 [Acacia pycnantha]
MFEPSETMMESRQEVMVSPVGDSQPTVRIAHFLKPSVPFNDPLISEIPSSYLPSPSVFDLKKWRLSVKFIGWPGPLRKWIHWVDSMHSTYESLWKKVGIYEAIMGTKFNFLKDEDLIFGMAERWCSETNTFLFPWAEATITLEDIMILGGYPVLGDSVHKPLETQGLKTIEEKLILARQEIQRIAARKACLNHWMTIFMNSGRVIEHEAFLVAWLSIFVFPGKFFSVNTIVFPIAIHLARGTAIALAPAVLASIYRDLSLLKQTMVALTRNVADASVEEHLQLELRSLFYLVQIWVWERLVVLQPKPNVIIHGNPVIGRWHRVKALKIGNVRSVIDSAMDDFVWRPYAIFASKHRLFYAENSMWVPLDHPLDDEIMSFIICMRISELVGLDCIEHYFPHRVSMQFGMDQDIPGSVTLINKAPEIAWNYYIRPITDSKVYIPSRFFEPDVTTRYVEWWKESVQGHQDPVKNLVQRKRSTRTLKKRSNDANAPPGFPPKYRKSSNFASSSGFLLEGSESNQIGVFPSPFATGKTDVSVANGADIFAEKENLIEYVGPKCDMKTEEMSSFAFATDRGTVGQVDLQMKPLVEIESETSMAGLQEAVEKVNGNQGSQQSNLAYDKVNLSWIEEDNSYAFDMFVVDLESRISKVERVLAELKQ